MKDEERERRGEKVRRVIEDEGREREEREKVRRVIEDEEREKKERRCGE